MLNQKFKKQRIKFKLEGTSPLLMHNPRGMDPLNPLSKAMKRITSKRGNKITEEEYAKIQDIEFELGLYYDDSIGPYVPAHCLKATIREGAKKTRCGTIVMKALTVIGDKIPLIYDGSRILDELRKDSAFRDVRPAKVGGTILRTRPKFERWELEAEVKYDVGELNFDQVVDFLEVAGEFGGLLDGRIIGFGKFKVVEIEEIKESKSLRKRSLLVK